MYNVANVEKSGQYRSKAQGGIMNAIHICRITPPNLGRMETNEAYTVYSTHDGLKGENRGKLERSAVVNLIRNLPHHYVFKHKIVDTDMGEKFEWSDMYFRRVEWNEDHQSWFVHVVQEWLD